MPEEKNERHGQPKIKPYQIEGLEELIERVTELEKKVEKLEMARM